MFDPPRQTRTNAGGRHGGQSQNAGAGSGIGDPEARPPRGIGHEKVLTRLDLDAQAERLMDEGALTKDTILETGLTFYLRSTGNMSTGGTAIDLTNQCHPDNCEMAAGLLVGDCGRGRAAAYRQPNHP